MHRTADSRCAQPFLSADAQLIFFFIEPPFVTALAFLSSASRSPLVDIRSASSRSFFRHSEFSIFSVRSDPIHIAISIQVAVFAQALESMCGNIANMIATGISIDLKGGILVGMSERMNATILPRTRKEGAGVLCGETLARARSQLGIHESDVVSNVTKSNRPGLAWLKKGVKARDSLSFVTKLSPLNSRLSETFPFWRCHLSRETAPREDRSLASFVSNPRSSSLFDLHPPCRPWRS